MATGTLRSRLRVAASWVGALSVWWVVTDLLGGRLGWATLIAVLLTAVAVVLIQASFLWVDRIDQRERATNTPGTSITGDTGETGDTAPPNARRG